MNEQLLTELSADLDQEKDLPSFTKQCIDCNTSFAVITGRHINLCLACVKKYLEGGL